MIVVNVKLVKNTVHVFHSGHSEHDYGTGLFCPSRGDDYLRFPQPGNFFSYRNCAHLLSCSLTSIHCISEYNT